MSRSSSSRDVHALSLRIGGWFEAQASGWGLVAVLLLVLLLVAGTLGASLLA
jgi:hypothetical protein